MAHIYALVVTDEHERGFDKVALDLSGTSEDTNPFVGRSYELQFLTNPLVPADEPDDFEALVLQHGAVLDSLNSEDEPYAEDENLKHLVNVTTRILAEVRSRARACIPTLDAALDRWDEFASYFTDPELESEEQ